jgi:DDE superfamily endonuclease
VQRILTQAHLKPHRLERYLASDDPDFESRAADIIGLYLDPPKHAAVFCVDEKTATQALDRLDPVPRYRGDGRNGLVSSITVTGLCRSAPPGCEDRQGRRPPAERHTSAEFIVFLWMLVNKARWAKQIHIVLDNLSAHKTKAVEEFLEQNPKVSFDFTRIYSSWLNQVE